MAQTEMGPVIAGVMIAVGVIAIVWAVGTKEHPEPERPNVQFSTNVGGDPAEPAAEEADPNAITDAEWEAALKEVEAIKGDGLVTDIDVSAQKVTVDDEKWSALSDDRKQEIGKRLALYCGRVSGSDEHAVSVVGGDGESIADYSR